MRILAVLASEYPGITPSGGAGTMMRDLLEGLVARGWEAEVSLAGGHSREVINGVAVSSEEYLLRPDVVISHLGGIPRARRMAGHPAWGAPLVQLVHNTSEATVGFLAQRPDFVIFNSRWTQSYHEARRKVRIKYAGGELWPSIVVHPPALDYPIPLAQPGKKITLVNLVPNKGPDIFYRLAETYPQFEFLGVRGGYEPNKQVIKNLPNVEIREWTEDLNSVYKDTSILIVPSIYESYSRCAVEAMSYGIPVIASETLGLAECLGPIPRYPRSDFVAWCKTLECAMANYGQYSDQSIARGTELFHQTPGEIDNLDRSLRELIT